MTTNDTAIRVSGLSKAYTIHHNKVNHSTAAEAALHRLRHPFRRAEKETFWALNDLDFEVKKGDVVGIIGRNGAGKSTLLKVLSRITEPTRGRIELFGRVGSLLEVGTGFHPELTGRENVYLNGTILGMQKPEINAQFDAIVDFAGVEQFLDTPVKRYSSGMKVRLAFAVAAHLRTEILIVDEVLAVGDVEFQKKCIGKMQDVATGEGRTVLFVSHRMGSIQSLCDRVQLLEAGQQTYCGEVPGGIAKYQEAVGELSTAPTIQFKAPQSATSWMTNARLFVDDSLQTEVPMGSQLRIEVDYVSTTPLRKPAFGITIDTADGVRLVNTNNRFQSDDNRACGLTQGTIVCDLGIIYLLPRRYEVALWFGDEHGDNHVETSAFCIDVLYSDLWGTGRNPGSRAQMWWPATFQILPAKETALIYI